MIQMSFRHWKTKEHKGYTIVDDKWASELIYYPFELNSNGYVFVRNAKFNEIFFPAIGIHRAIYFLEYGILSKEGINAVHHKDDNKWNNTLNNLGLKPWNNGSSGKYHGPTVGPIGPRREEFTERWRKIK